VAVQGQSWSWLFATFKPRNDLMIQPAVIGCTCTSPDLFCEPTFLGRGVECMRQPVFSLPAVVVLGLGVQPMLLPMDGYRIAAQSNRRAVVAGGWQRWPARSCQANIVASNMSQLAHPPPSDRVARPRG
jgi:hypothetical protein